MSDVDDLAAWFAEQLAEDERLALKARQGAWWASAAYGKTPFVGCGEGADAFAVAVCGSLGRKPAAWNAEHIARQDPRQTLARVAAGRLLLAEFAAASSWAGRVAAGEPAGDASGLTAAAAGAVVATWKQALRVAASGYAHRSGWRGEWAP